MEAVEDGGYEANLRTVDEEGDVELDDPEIKAAKVGTIILHLEQVMI